MHTFASVNRTNKKTHKDMPVNKDALKRFRIMDQLLSDPNHDYTTDEIAYRVNRECTPVSLRMIQKDILAIEEEFGKKIVRNAGGRGTVRYEDQSQPIFYKELTSDEEEVLREVLKTLGQFEGLENFTWLELLKKKLEMDRPQDQRPLISFSRNDILQMPPTLLGRLFTAISKKETIRFTYTPFGQAPREVTAYPYQLKQYNDRWFLLATPVGTDEEPYDPEFIANYALDRISEEFDYEEKIEYKESPVDFDLRFDEVIGVTLYKDAEVESIYFAVRPTSLNYVRTKFMHPTQMEFEEETADDFRKKYPSLADCGFFSIECRPNYELYSKFASFGANVIILEPTFMAEHMRNMMKAAAEGYGFISE